MVIRGIGQGRFATLNVTVTIEPVTALTVHGSDHPLPF
jgi:hypothetical protein